MVIVASVALTTLAAIVAYTQVPGLDVPSMLPITLTACTLAPYSGLLLAGLRNPFDMWAGFTYAGILAFVVSPVFHLVTGDTIVRGLPADFEPLLRFVAWTSVPVVPLFYWGYRAALRHGAGERERLYRAVDPRRARGVGSVLVGVGALAQVIFYGIYRDQLVTDAAGTFVTATAGSLLILADLANVGILLLLYAWLVSRSTGRRRHPYSTRAIVFIILACLLVVAANFYRGSRTFILIYVVWGVCLFAQFVRPIHVLVVIVGFVATIGPLTYYKLYKSLDYQHLDAILFDPAFREDVMRQSGRTPSLTLAGDLGRYYVWMLFRQELRPGGELDMQWGRTYLASLLTPVPRWLLYSKPRGIVELTTDAEMGRGYYAAYTPRAARVGGIWAEGYVNFGIAGVWLSAALYGWLLGRVKRYFATLPADGIGHFFYGMFALWGIPLLMADSRLIVWNLVRLAVIALVIVRLAGVKVEPRRESAAGWWALTSDYRRGHGVIRPR